MILFGDALAVCGDVLALVAFAVDAMAVGMGRESRHDAATDSFMVMLDLLWWLHDED